MRLSSCFCLQSNGFGSSDGSDSSVRRRRQRLEPAVFEQGVFPQTRCPVTFAETLAVYLWDDECSRLGWQCRGGCCSPFRRRGGRLCMRWRYEQLSIRQLNQHFTTLLSDLIVRSLMSRSTRAPGLICLQQNVLGCLDNLSQGLVRQRKRGFIRAGRRGTCAARKCHPACPRPLQAYHDHSWSPALWRR